MHLDQEALAQWLRNKLLGLDLQESDQQLNTVFVRQLYDMCIAEGKKGDYHLIRSTLTRMKKHN